MSQVKILVLQGLPLVLKDSEKIHLQTQYAPLNSATSLL